MLESRHLNRTARALVGLISMAMAALPAKAETQTLWVKGYPITKGGELMGCSLEYNAAVED